MLQNTIVAIKIKVGTSKFTDLDLKEKLFFEESDVTLNCKLDL